MVHAVSATYLRFERMSPPAAGMALVLHLSVALALWWVSPLKFIESEPEPIEVTMEAPKPQPAPPQPAPPPPPAAEAAPATPSAAAPPPPPSSAATPTPTQVPLGVTPPPPGTAEKQPVPEAPKEEPAKEAPAPKQEPQQALAPPKVEPEPQPPPVDKVLPKVEAPAPPLTMRDFVRIAPPPQPRDIVKPLPQQGAPAPPQRQALRPSPLGTEPPSSPNSTNSPSSTFVNPAETFTRTRAQDEYVWMVIRKFSQYLPNLRDKNEGGTVRLRFVIARDGRLLEASIAQSSGVLALDRGLLDAVRAAAPYPPLPPEFTGDRATFMQDITAKQ